MTTQRKSLEEKRAEYRRRFLPPKAITGKIWYLLNNGRVEEKISKGTVPKMWTFEGAPTWYDYKEGEIPDGVSGDTENKNKAKELEDEASGQGEGEQ